MFLGRKIRLPAAWAALLALLFGIAWPTLAAAQAVDSPAFMQEICRSAGSTESTMPAASGALSVTDHASLLHDGHCQLCPIGTPAYAAPHAASALPVAARPTHKPVPPCIVPASQHSVCPPPPSHAPPLFS